LPPAREKTAKVISNIFAGMKKSRALTIRREKESFQIGFKTLQ